IRDYKVTGVQTCALPIYDLNLPDRGLRFLPLDPEVTVVGDHTSFRIWRDGWRTQAELMTKSPRDAEAYPRFTAFLRDFATALDRSEERRVGKAGGRRQTT